MTGQEFCFGHPKRDFIRSLMWKSRSSHRRKDFPTWSWLGWKGTITLAMWQENCPDVSRPDVLLVDVDEIPSGTHFVVEKCLAQVIAYPDEKSGQTILKMFSQVARLKAIKVVQKGKHFQATNRDENDGTSEAKDDLWCLNIAHSHDLPCTHAGVGWFSLTVPVSVSIPKYRHG